MIRSRKR